MKYLVLLQAILLSATVAAADSAAPAKGDDSIKNKIEKSLQQARPDFVVQQIEKTELPGLYAVYLTNGAIFYMNATGTYLIEGSLYRIVGKQMVDVREEKLKPLRAKILAGIPKGQMIVYPAEGDTKAVINVFTDVDCPFCQKLHAHMAEFNKRGIEVRYLAFPRMGPGSPTARKLVSAWCAEDKQDAFTRLTQRQPISDATCENPVAAQYDLGEKIGVNGTPAVYAVDGTYLGGYIDPDQMSRLLGLM